MEGQELNTPYAKKDEEERSIEKGWGRGMNVQEKLALIWDYCKYAWEYRPTNKTAFWVMIWNLLK